MAQTSGVDLGSDRSLLISLLDDAANGRAMVLTRLASDQRVVDANYNQALVLFQYFTYLRRSPDEAGYNAWVNTLKSKPLRDPMRPVRSSAIFSIPLNIKTASAWSPLTTAANVISRRFT